MSTMQPQPQPRKANSRGVRLGAQLAKPAASVGVLSVEPVKEDQQPPLPPPTSAPLPLDDSVNTALEQSNGAPSRTENKSSTATTVSSVGSDAPIELPVRVSSAMPTSSSPGRLPASTLDGTTPSPAAVTAQPAGTGSGPTPPRPKMGGRVAAMAAKLSGMDVSPPPKPNSAVLPPPSRPYVFPTSKSSTSSEQKASQPTTPSTSTRTLASEPTPTPITAPNPAVVEAATSTATTASVAASSHTPTPSQSISSGPTTASAPQQALPNGGSSNSSSSNSGNSHSQPHNKTIGRLSRLTYARNDGVSVFGVGGPHGGGKGWSEYAGPSSAPRSPSLHGSNGFSASFGNAAANTSTSTATTGSASVAGSSRGGSLSITSGISSARTSVDASGLAGGTPLGLAIANAGIAMNSANNASGAVAGAHGLTLALSPDLSQTSTAFSGAEDESGALSSPAPYKLLNAALMSARNSLPGGTSRSDLPPTGRDKDGVDRQALPAVEEASAANEQMHGDDAAMETDAVGSKSVDAEMEHSISKPGPPLTSVARGGPRASLPTQRELLLPALQNAARTALEGHDHRRDTFSLGPGTIHASQRPLSALVDDPAALLAATSPTTAEDSQTQNSLNTPLTRSARGSYVVAGPSSAPTNGNAGPAVGGELDSNSRLTEVADAITDSSRPDASVNGSTSKITHNTPRARLPPGPDDQIDGLIIRPRPDGGFTYLDANGQPLGSKTVLTLAIEKAQTAVTLDSSNRVAEAITAYKHALRLLEEVMERIAPKPGQKPKPNREEERKRLIIIHDTYADRIRLLSAIKGSSTRAAAHGAKASLSQQSQRTNSDVQSTFNADMIPQRPKGHHGQDRPQRSDGFHEAIAAAHAEMEQERRDSLHHFLNNDNTRSRPTSRATEERPASVARSSNSMRRDDSPVPSEHEDALLVDAASAQTTRAAPVDDTKRDSLATAQTSHTMTPRHHLAQAVTSDRRMPQISIQPDSPQGPLARLSEPPQAADVTLDAQFTKVRQAHSAAGTEALQHARTDSEGSNRSDSASRTGRQRSSSPANGQRNAPTEGFRTPTTPYFDSSSQLHMDDEPSPMPTVRQGFEWTAQPLESLSNGAADKDRVSGLLGVGLMSPPQIGGLGDGGRARPTSVYTEGGASQAASDGHLSTGPEADLDRALAGLDASLSQLSQERMHGTVKASGRRQSRASLRSATAGADKAAVTGAAATTPAPPLPTGAATTVTARRQKTSSTASRPDSRTESPATKNVSEFPRMSGQESDVENEPEPRPTGSARQRSSSQPAPKRPPIPFSFMNGVPQPPMPRLVRKGSTSSNHVLSPTSASANRAAAGSSNGSSIRPGPGGQSNFRFPSPAPSAMSTFAPSDAPLSGLYDEHGLPRPAPAFDLFPTGLPSMKYSGVPSFAAPVSNSALPGVDMDAGAHDYMQWHPMPANVISRPFYVLRQLHASLSTGGHLSRKLYAPKHAWLSAAQQQANNGGAGSAKIASLDLKVRMLDLVITGMEPVQAGGKALLQPPVTSQPGLLAVQATRFARQLDDFEHLLLDVQSTLSSKLNIVDPAAGKKNKNAFGSLGSRLKGSLGGLTSNKGLDSPSDYISSLTRLCAKLGTLDQHVQSVIRAQAGATENDVRSPGTESYAALPTEVRLSIEAKLKRTSDWLANVLLCFVLRDVALVMDRYTKRASIPFVEG